MLFESPIYSYLLNISVIKIIGMENLRVPRRKSKIGINSDFSKHSLMTSDVFGIFLTYLPTYPNQILYYVRLFSKIRFSLTYLLKNLTSYVNAP